MPTPQELLEIPNERKNEIQLPFVHLFKNFHNFFNSTVLCHMYIRPAFVRTSVLISSYHILMRCQEHLFILVNNSYTIKMHFFDKMGRILTNRPRIRTLI